jgi:hypothetical protein
VVQVHTVQRRARIIATGLGAVYLGIALPSTAGAKSSALQVEAMLDACRPVISIADTIHEHDRVTTRVQEAICTTLQRHGVDLAELPAGRRLVVDVRDLESQRIVSVTVEQDGARVEGSPEASTCRCDDEEMLTELSRATVAAVPLLARQTTTTTREATPRTPQPAGDAMAPASRPTTGGSAPLGIMGKTGIGFLAAGTAGSVIGISLVVQGARVDRRLEQRGGYDLRPAGYAVLGASLALGITGAVLLGVDRRRARRVQAVVPTVGPGLVGLTAAGRF